MKDPGSTRDPTDETDEDFNRPVPSHHQRLLDMCARKEKFATWHHARAASKRVNRRKIDDRYVAPFKCPVCSGIHIGSSPKRRNWKGTRP